MKHTATFLLLASGLLSAQDAPLYGVFPHYASGGGEWTTKVYLTVDTVHVTLRTACQVKIGFADQRSLVMRYMGGNFTLHDPSTSGFRFANWYWTPDNTGALAVGPVFVYTNCPDQIKTGELIFSQTIDGRRFDGSVPLQRINSNHSRTKHMIVDTRSYDYGFAVYNLSPDAVTLNYVMYVDGTERPEVLFVTLAGYEQRILTLKEVDPALKTGTHFMTLKQINGNPEDLFILSLKFNFAGSFSTGILVD